MTALLIGDTRVSTDEQDLLITAQRDALSALGVGRRAHLRRPRSHRHQPRPARPARGLGRLPRRRHAGGDQLDRLARSLPDAREILDDLTRRSVELSLRGLIDDPADPAGRLLFNLLAVVAEFESDLIRLRTREGMKVAKARGRLRGKQPKLNPGQDAHPIALYEAGEHSTGELSGLRRGPLDRLPRHERNRHRHAPASVRPSAPHRWPMPGYGASRDHDGPEHP
jgi:hypothetical protein